MSLLASLPVGPAQFAVRRATAADVTAIVGLLADDELGAAREDLSEAGRPAYRAAFDRIDADPGQLLVIVTADDGTVAGTMQLTFVPGLGRRGALRTLIEAVRVGCAYRSRGLGQAMIEWAIAEARRRNCQVVQLTSDKQRPSAHRFYERLGFTASHEGFKLLI